jgi:hypothetical protein
VEPRRPLHGERFIRTNPTNDRHRQTLHTLQRQRPIEADILGRCRAWLASLPPSAVLEQIIPNVEDGLSLFDVRARIKKLQNQVEALERVPVPACRA